MTADERRSMPYKKYFGEMPITETQKRKRTEAARKMQNTLEEVFLLISEAQKGVLQGFDALNVIGTAISMVRDGYIEVMPDDLADTEFASVYVNKFASETVRATYDHLDDEYYTSEDRAMFIAENEANTMYEDEDYILALKEGMTRKRWVTMQDRRVRDTHREVEGATIPIDEFFQVGGALMLYPKDVINGGDFPEEIVNCRCSCIYLP